MADINKTPAHDKLLLAGWELLLERSGDLMAVKMKDLVERSGLTSGAFYNVWPGGIADFQTSLLEFAFARDRIAYFTELVKSLEGVTPNVMPLSEVARVFGGVDADKLLNDPVYPVQVALWARHRSDPRVTETLGRSYREFGGEWANVYTTILDNYGRRWREPWTSDLFATSLTGLAEGLTMRRAVDPASTPSDLAAPGGEERPWTLFALCAGTLLAAATEPAKGRARAAWAAVAELDKSK